MTRRFKPTPEQRKRVEILIAGGMSEEGIAHVLGITRPTLRKHFESELLNGRSTKRAEMIAALFKRGIEGNVAAQKAFIQLNTLAGAEASILEDRRPKARVRPLGKKEVAALEAETAGDGSEWGDDLKVASSTIN